MCGNDTRERLRHRYVLPGKSDNQFIGIGAGELINAHFREARQRLTEQEKHQCCRAGREFQVSGVAVEADPAKAFVRVHPSRGARVAARHRQRVGELVFRAVVQEQLEVIACGRPSCQPFIDESLSTIAEADILHL